MSIIPTRVISGLIVAQWMFAQTAIDSRSATVLYLLNAVSGNGLIFDSPATLYSVDTGGQVHLVDDVADGGSGNGIDFALADYDRRIIVVASPKTLPSRVSIISMDQPAAVVVKALGTATKYDRFSPSTACLIEPSVGGLFIAQVLIRTLVEASPAHPIPEMEQQLVATPLSSDGELQTLPENEKVRCRTSGYFGTAWDHPPYLPLAVRPNEDLSVYHNGRRLPVGLQAPPTAKQSLDGALEVKTDAATVFTSQEERVFDPAGLGTSVHHIYSNSAKHWNSLKVPGSDSSVRAFGKWLAFVVAERQAWAVPNATGIARYDPASERFSLGPAGRLLNKLPGHPEASVNDFFGASDKWFPGTLLCYSLETGRLYKLETGQGDSEILLIDGSDIYYRVNTSVFKGKIGAYQIEPGARIAEDPAIGNAHWAFLFSH
jgi:hypothetical protein